MTLMADANSAKNARMKGLTNKADKYGIIYTTETEESVLREAIKEYESNLAPDEPAKAAPESSASDIGVAIGKAVAKEMASVVRAAKAGEDDGMEMVTEDQFDPNDLTEPQTYFTPQIFWILPAKQVGSQSIMAPYKKIVFSLEQGDKVQNGTQFNTKYTSAFTTRSKKEQAHMETHPYFNRVFFKSEADLTFSGVKVKYAQRFALHMQTLNNTMAPELYKMSPGLDVKLNHGMSLAVLRTKIAEALTQRDMDAAEAELQHILTNTGRSGLLSATPE